MKQLSFLLKKEFLQIFRNKFLIRIIIMLPLAQLAILPWAATFEQKNITLNVLDNDKSSCSVQLSEKILSSQFFKQAGFSSSYNEALRTIESDNADLVLEIPRDFEKQMMNAQDAHLMITANALNGQKAGLGVSYITQIINDFYLEKNAAGVAVVPAVNVKPYYRYNTDMNYRNYMVPGILVILVSLLGGMLSALNIVREKEMGTMEQLNVTPISKSTFILGKLIPFWIIGLFNLTMGMFITWLIYGLLPAGSFATIYLFSIIYLFAFTGLGLIISNFAKSQQQAMFMLIFLLICFILLSGLFTPITSMPGWMQTFTLANPIRYFIEVMRLIYLKGSCLADIVPNLLAICVFLVLFNGLAVLSYRKTSH